MSRSSKRKAALSLPESRLSEPAQQAIADARAFNEAKRAAKPHRGLTTAARHQHDVITPVPTERAGVNAARVESQAPIDWLHERGLISDQEWIAGTKLYEAWCAGAGAGARAAGDYLRVDGGRHAGMNGAAFDAVHEVADALRKVDLELAPVLEAVVLRGDSAHDWAKSVGLHPQAAVPILRLALSRLARVQAGFVMVAPKVSDGSRRRGLTQGAPCK